MGLKMTMTPDPTKTLAPSTSILSALDKTAEEMKRPERKVEWDVVSFEQRLAADCLIALCGNSAYPSGSMASLARQQAKELCEHYRQS